MEDGAGPGALEDACEELRLLLRHVECSLPPGGLLREPHLPELLRAAHVQLAVFEDELGRLRRAERCWGTHHLGLLLILRRDAAYLRGVLCEAHRQRAGASSPN